MQIRVQTLNEKTKWIKVQYHIITYIILLISLNLNRNLWGETNDTYKSILLRYLVPPLYQLSLKIESDLTSFTMNCFSRE